MINIAYQTATGQYDSNGRQITHWDEKRCSWIVNKPFIQDYKNNQINWWGNDNDFPVGTTKEIHDKHNPGCSNYPDISLYCVFDQEGFKKGFPREDYNKYPNGYSYSKSWGHLNYFFEDALRLKNYLPCNKYADKIVITWKRNSGKNKKLCRICTFTKVNEEFVQSFETKTLTTK